MHRPLRAALITAALLLSACSAPGQGGSAATPEAATVAESPSPRSTAPASTAAEPSSGTSAEATPGALTSDPLHLLRLVDVRTGEEVLLGELAAQKPLLIETMAIWCSNCRAQQHNVVAAHNEADFHSLSLDVDPGEQPDDLAAYAEREGFDWHFAMADASILSQLRDRFGTAVAVPPGMPKILFRTDGSIELIGLGELYTAQQIAAAVNG